MQIISQEVFELTNPTCDVSLTSSLHGISNILKHTRSVLEFPGQTKFELTTPRVILASRLRWMEVRTFSNIPDVSIIFPAVETTVAIKFLAL